MSLQDLMTRSKLDEKLFSPRELIYNPSSSQLTVGDIVVFEQLNKSNGNKDKIEGIVVEKDEDGRLKIESGEKTYDIPLDQCALILRNDEYEIGDKVEIRPEGSNLFFIGKVVKILPDKSIDVQMDGDDPDDIEYGVLPENARKLMSRRALVVNRWKKAFMMVVATNFFKRIDIGDSSKHGNHNFEDENDLNMLIGQGNEAMEYIPPPQ